MSTRSAARVLLPATNPSLTTRTNPHAATEPRAASSRALSRHIPRRHARCVTGASRPAGAVLSIYSQYHGARRVPAGGSSHAPMAHGSSRRADAPTIRRVRRPTGAGSIGRRRRAARARGSAPGPQPPRAPTTTVRSGPGALVPRWSAWSDDGARGPKWTVERLFGTLLVLSTANPCRAHKLQKAPDSPAFCARRTWHVHTTYTRS